jgi:hypothetical protein
MFSKRLREPLKQFIALLAATGLAFYLAPTIHQLVSPLYQLVPLYSPAQPATELEFARVIVPFMVPIIYLIFGVIYEVFSRIPLIGVRLDERAVFVGTYLSLSTDPDYLNIFNIDFKSGKFYLVGYRFSFSANKATGNWNSEQLEMQTTEPPSLLYIYAGKQNEPDKLSGRGFVEITFNGRRPYRGHGSWVSALPQLKPQHANYVKLTANVRKKLFRKPVFFNRHEYPYIFIRRLIRDPETVFRAFAALTDNEKIQDPFQRAINPS